MLTLILEIAAVVIVAIVLFQSFHNIGPAQVGLVTKKIARKSLAEGNPVARHGEAGYQERLLMPGLRVRLWPIYGVSKQPWVQVPAGEIGVVIAQVGNPIKIGAKSADFRPAFGNFSNLGAFIDNGGQKGVQRPVLPPGTLVPIHPAAFLVITASRVYGVPVSRSVAGTPVPAGQTLQPSSFGLSDEQLRVTIIGPVDETDMVGVITALEGEPLPAGDIASRLGGFEDVVVMEAAGASDAEIIDVLLGRKNELHNNYQDFQAFMDHGGRIGLQHDTLLYGAYLLNPFLVAVEMVPMLVVRQGEVAVMKSFVGLPTLDTSGVDFKFGSIVHPGRRGIWQEPLRTGKYPLNPRIYATEIVPTSILTLNWSSIVSQAHNLDASLSPIEGKSREGFVFRIDLQVQIHVSDTKAPKVISMVGTMQNLVNEVLQSAVGNHFRNTLQRLEAVRFIETRDQVQASAMEAVTHYLTSYEVETRGVYIQDVVFPEQLVVVLTQREIAKQEKATFHEQREAQNARIEVEKARGTADMQGQLATSQVSIEINSNAAEARAAQARGEAAYIETTARAEATRIEAIGRAEATKVEVVGLAEATATEAVGVAEARAYQAQADAIGPQATALVAAVNAVAEGRVNVVPEVLVTGGGSSIEGLAASLIGRFAPRPPSRNGGNGDAFPPPPPAPELDLEIEVEPEQASAG